MAAVGSGRGRSCADRPPRRYRRLHPGDSPRVRALVAADAIASVVIAPLAVAFGRVLSIILVLLLLLAVVVAIVIGATASA